MKKIDRETVQKIIDAADIVEVVSDFVRLKRRGANYIGLCPFHNERTPSFSVSKAKGICKCFSCGKGGSPVNFIMEHEQMTYQEALRYLARKYNIEIKEHEISEAEREEETRREAMLMANEFAMRHFEHNLSGTDDGRDIGLSYFRERGINDRMIERFHLGYALDRNEDLLGAARRAGIKEDYLVDTGLCVRTDRGALYDRFKGRVIYPVQSLSGKVVAFGGRTLRKDKGVSKYVNSPESIIYSKSRELYGLYQAKQAITKKDKCILVEGYMDVISMHQNGVENVVASSGTSLTEGQIRLIHRFTQNVTVIYDSDPAGIKASLRGIDMLLAEGLSIKVLSLPEGDDPDSYAQSHSASELEEYLATHEVDFIRFKTDILLKGLENDPVARSRVINDILRSVAVIPDPIARQVYIGECSRSLGLAENVLARQVARLIAERIEKDADAGRRRKAEASLGDPASPKAQEPEPADRPSGEIIAPVSPAPAGAGAADADAAYLRSFEYNLLRYVVRYGMAYLCDEEADDGSLRPMTLLDYVKADLECDGIRFSNPPLAELFDKVSRVARDEWPDAYGAELVRAEAAKADSLARGVDEIRAAATDLTDIHAREVALRERVESEYRDALDGFACRFLVRSLISVADDTMRGLVTEMAADRYTLSKVHTKYSHVPSERERLGELVPRAVSELKDAILTCKMRRVRADIAAASASGDTATLNDALTRLQELMRIKSEFAHFLGERIVLP